MITFGIMGLHIHIYQHSDKETKEALDSINHKLNKIMATQAEHAAELRAIKDQNDKARAEVLAKIADLETALANAGNTTPEVDEAMAALKASVQTDDDIVAD
jgi:chromosome segregation ATPase